MEQGSAAGGRRLQQHVNRRMHGRFERRQSLVTLRDRINATLGPIVSGYSECALVGFPDSANVGDSAIWLGELAWLRERAFACDRCHERDYDANILAQSCPTVLSFCTAAAISGFVAEVPAAPRARDTGFPSPAHCPASSDDPLWRSRGTGTHASPSSTVIPI